jgi:hypothetical protein
MASQSRKRLIFIFRRPTPWASYQWTSAFRTLPLTSRTSATPLELTPPPTAVEKLQGVAFADRKVNCDCLDVGQFAHQLEVHAVGGGVLMAEVQQTSDATFRLFDWNRRDAQGQLRTLHVEQALACINWKAGPVQPVHAEGYPQGSDAAPSSKPVRQPLVACRYFTLDYIRQREAFGCGGGKMQVLVVAHGRGTLSGPAGSCELRPGDTVLLPAGVAPQECWPEGDSLGLLRASLP